MSVLGYIILAATLVTLLAILVIVRLALKWRWGRVDRSNEICAWGKTVLITGANTGIGLAAVLEFARRDATVILACRDLQKANEAVSWVRSKTKQGKLICLQLDLASLDSVRQFAHQFQSKFDKLDILILNAGIIIPPGDRVKTQDGFEIHMGVNHLGHFLLTNLLLEQCKKAAPSRIVTVSSMTHSWSKLDLDDLMSEKKGIERNPVPIFINALYAKSKLANALFSKELSKRLAGTGVQTYALCPGFVFTYVTTRHTSPVIATIQRYSRFALKWFIKSPEEGAATILYCAPSKDLSNESGEMYHHCKPWHQSSRVALSEEDAKRLWDESARLVGL